MADLIRSAFGYFSGPNQGVKEHDLIGASVSLGRSHFRIRRVIAEGGYAVVLEGYDSSQGKSFAIKRLFASDEEVTKTVLNEIDVIRRLSGHPNIMKFYGVASAGKEKSKHVGNEYLIVTELCSGGSLHDYLPPPHHDKLLSANIVLQILAQTSCALQHMHKQSPPIIHRDLKIENILLSETFIIKICDFGSATTETYAPDMSWSANQRGRVQENLEKVTTPMYRSPEMLDLYLNYPINEALDIWAFGCIIFYLVCGYHPFEDSAKLAILNANYNLPPCDADFQPFHNLIRQMLLVDPTQRPNINSVYGELSDLATARDVPAFDSIVFNEEVRRRLAAMNRSKDTPTTPSAPPQTPSSNPPPPPLPPYRPSAAPTRTPTAAAASSATRAHHAGPPSPPDGSISSSSLDSAPDSRQSGGGGGSGVLGFLKGGASHLIKNIKETSSRVMEAVTAAVPNDLDLQYITSRIAVMSYPAESGLEAVVGTRNSMEEAQAYLERHHPKSYAVYNLSPRAYRSSHWFGGRVSFRPLEANRAPSLWSLVELCQNARLWLSQKPDNVCVVHCTNGKQVSALLVCALLCFCRVFPDAASALKFFISKRGPVRLTPAQMRYIGYVAKLVTVPPRIPHNHPIELVSIIVAPVPSFNRLKNGCRPYVEVFQGNKKVFTSMTDYESLRTYEFEDRRIEFVLNGLTVCGDITVCVYHARSIFAGKGKAASVKICQLQFHTGFIDQKVEKITFLKAELDHLHSSSGPNGNLGHPMSGNGGVGGGTTSRYAESFHADVHLAVSGEERPRHAGALVFPWETLPAESARPPSLCFSDAFEMRSVMSPAALKAAGFSSTGQPPTVQVTKFNHEAKPVPPHPPPGNPSPTEFRRRIKEHQEAHHESTTPTPPPPAPLTPTTPKTPPTVEMLIEGLEANHLGRRQDEAKETEEKREKSSVEEPATVADLLGIHSDRVASPSSATPTPPPPPTNTTTTSSTSNPLFDDFFASPSAAPENIEPATDDWQDLWSSTTTATATAAEGNFNPFDPFGTATQPPEDETPSPTAANGHGSSPTPPRSPTGFDPFGSAKTRGKAVHTSSSMSNLFGETDPKGHAASSSSSSNLNQGGGGGNPFEEFGEFFEAAKRGGSGNAHSRSATTSSTSAGATAGNMPGATPFGFPFMTTSTGAFNPHRSTPPSGQRHQQQPAYASPRHGQPPHPPPSSGGFQGTRPRPSEDAFEDLLGGAFGSSRKNEQPKTLAQIRHQKLAQTEDPEVLKVIEWCEGKEKNVRALLCTLGSVLWEGVRWEQISMADVMTVKQVKQQYRKAARAVHPDKWMGSEHVNMAKLILMELNDAMAEFEKQEECAA